MRIVVFRQSTRPGGQEFTSIGLAPWWLRLVLVASALVLLSLLAAFAVALAAGLAALLLMGTAVFALVRLLERWRWRWR